MISFADAHLFDCECDWHEREARVNALKNSLSNSSQNFPACYFPFVLKPEEFKLFATSLFTNVSAKDSEVDVGNAQERIRIGYLSIDFRTHSAGVSLGRFLSAHDKGKFEIWGVSFAKGESAARVRGAYSSCFENYLDCGEMAEEQAFQAVKEAKLDILIDTTRHIADSPVGLLTRKPCPIQISAWGYGGTSGNPSMDYCFLDHTLASEDILNHLSERCLLLENYHPLFREEVRQGELGRGNFGLPESAFVFACFNAHYKITPQLFSAWMRILKSVPEGVLWLSSGSEVSRRNLLLEARKDGVEDGKIVFAERLPRSEHLSRLEFVDLGLDNPNLGGGATLADCLIAGRPVLGLSGNSVETRSSASMLQLAGLEHCLAADLDDYVTKALNFATDSEALAIVCDEVKRVRDTSVLFDVESFARDVERHYLEILNAP